MGGMIAIAEGIGTQADANTNSQLSTALSAIGLISSYTTLQEAYSKILDTDAHNIYVANLKVPGNPGGTALVSQATAQREIDSTLGDRDENDLDNLIQGQKSMAQTLGNTLTQVFDLMEPIYQSASLTSQLIQQMAG